MEDYCLELAQTGLDTNKLIFIGVFLVIFGVIIFIKRLNLISIGISVVAITLLASVVLPTKLQAQSTEHCPPGSSTISTSNPKNSNSNLVSALDDGPFITGDSPLDSVSIDLLGNDSPGNSSFDLSSVDLDPSTPGFDHTFYYSQGGTSGVFTYDPAQALVTFTPDNVYLGDRIVIQYTVKTINGQVAGPASIIIEIASDQIARGQSIQTCYDPIYVTNVLHDASHASGIDASTLDLDPSLPGIQTIYTSPAGVTYEVVAPGEIAITLPGDWIRTTDTDLIFFTVRTNDNTLSNAAAIHVHYGTCL